MRQGLSAAVLSAALTAIGCVDGGFGLNVHDSVDVTRPLAADGRFSLQNTNGTVHVDTWNEPRVRIEAVKSAANERALRDLEVLVEGEGASVSVRTRMPHGHWFGRGGKVDYTVTLPRGAAVSVSNVNGRIEIRGVNGSVQAQNVNGSVDANDLGGAVEASTVNGSVGVRLLRVDAGGRNRVSSTNGSVRVTLPRDAAFDLDASTVNGSVHCDFGVDGRSSRRRVEGHVGGGGARFEIQTVNGSARVDRGLSAASHPEATPATSERTRTEAEAPAAPAR
jgi:hypothetical protein